MLIFLILCAPSPQGSILYVAFGTNSKKSKFWPAPGPSQKASRRARGAPEGSHKAPRGAYSCQPLLLGPGTFLAGAFYVTKKSDFLIFGCKNRVPGVILQRYRAQGLGPGSGTSGPGPGPGTSGQGPGPGTSGQGPGPRTSGPGPGPETSGQGPGPGTSGPGPRGDQWTEGSGWGGV